MNYSLAGQVTAKEKIKDAMFSFFEPRGRRGKKPMVILLAGPPGHGKTVLAECVAELLLLKKIDPRDASAEDAYISIDLATQSSAESLFGYSSGLVGGEDGSALMNFLTDRNGEPSVVLLDELDKADSTLFAALMPVFEKGEVANPSKLHEKPVSVANTVFLVTTNWAQKEILDWYKSNKDALPGEDELWTAKTATWAHASCEPLIKEVVKASLGDEDALLRRFDYVVPFFPMNKRERLIMADDLLRRVCIDYSKPPVTSGKRDYRVYSGCLKIHYNTEIPEYFAEFYTPSEGGARILMKIRGSVDAGISRLWCANSLPEGTSLWLVLTDEKPRECVVTKEKPTWFK